MPDLNIDIFDTLLRYHSERNLAKCLPYIKDGVILSPANHYKPVEEGLENKEYDGILILKNGDTLIKKLVDDNLIDKRDVDTSKNVNTIDNFFNFLENRKDEDGVYVYESSKKLIMRVSKITYPGREIEGKIPLDFIYFNGANFSREDDIWVELRHRLGTKTRLAIELTQHYQDIEAFQIKRSSYTQLGMGKVTHFNKNGLNREFFFMVPKNPELHQDEFIDPEHKIIGVYREYGKDNGNLICLNQTTMNPLKEYTACLA